MSIQAPFSLPVDVTPASKLDFLDGLRGLAAFWVIVGHAMLLLDWHFPILSQPYYAVDLFMMISGFLMYYQAHKKAATEPMSHYSSWLTFWVRRFFRLAPVYYVIFAAAMLMAPMLLDARMTAGSVFPGAATPPERYTDQSALNIFTHLSFIFGALPYYHFRSPLPDWSIGLEIQFYAAFPFMILLIARCGIFFSAIALTLTALVVNAVFADFTQSFILPSLLSLKLNYFLAGMLVAHARTHPAKAPYPYIALALLLTGLEFHAAFTLRHCAVSLALTAGITLLALREQLGLPAFLKTIIRLLSEQLGKGIFKFLGDTSYSVYLIHLLVMIPTIGYIATSDIASMAPYMRVLTCLAVTIPVTYALGWVMLHAIELPGIACGKLMTSRFPRYKAVES